MAPSGNFMKSWKCAQTKYIPPHTHKRRSTKMIRYIEAELQDYRGRWNLRAINNRRSEAMLNGKEAKAKEVPIVVINAV